FSCQIHVEYLFQAVGSSERSRALVEALNERVVVAAVGPRCRAALASHGVNNAVVPENPKLGPMVAALARQFERQVVRS
ncbi:MAG TPA: uroporphyrinogen-III synthase, partial [Labilithrix sp.]|nr:uroporphyrinogen-III synthase [Labilithrix sp.]